MLPLMPAIMQSFQADCASVFYLKPTMPAQFFYNVFKKKLVTIISV